VWTLDKVAELVEEARAVNPELRALAFINRAESRGSENAEAAELIRSKPGLEFLPTALGARKAFAHAAAAGLSVTELRPQDPKASEEIGALFSHLFDTPKIPNSYPTEVR
jgi:chromosome partitioning protein